MRLNSRLSAFWLALLAAMASASCATVHGGAKAARTPLPPPQMVMSANPSEEAAAAPNVDEKIQEARALVALGRQLYQHGEMSEARANFDRAVERLGMFPQGARGDTRLADAYADLLREVQDLEASSYQTGSGLAPAGETPPIEDLDEVVPDISPEKAAAERELVENAAVQTDPPIIFNDRVLAWLDIYRGRMHDRFQEGLTRSGRYIGMIRRIFREEGLPEDLAYIAHVESAYKPTAYSRARAKGVWQFIVGTGTRYGLRRDWWIDERSDPELATRAAAAYLKDLYAMFGDWYLAMAAYNAGEGKIQRIIDRTGVRDFWAIAGTSLIRLETKNYVPAILAAIVISKNPEKFGFSSEKEPPVTYDAVAIDSATDLRVIANLSGSTVDELRRLNPALARLQTPPNYPDFEIHLPPQTGDRFADGFGQLARSERIPWKSHDVARGETLASLSRRYGVSMSQIREANGIQANAGLRSGTQLQIPTYVAPPAAGHGDLARTAKVRGTKSIGEKLVYKVRKGDTLSSIARRYKTTVIALQSWNRLEPSSALKPGDRIFVYYGREQGSETQPVIASLLPAGTDTRSSSNAGARRKGSAPSPTKTSAKTTYLVKKGDTLYRIATKLSATVEELCRFNKISEVAPLLPGTVLSFER